jgi:hypothetical protein
MDAAVFLGLLDALFHAFLRFICANIPPFRRRWSVKEMPELSGKQNISIALFLKNLYPNT